MKMKILFYSLFLLCCLTGSAPAQKSEILGPKETFHLGVTSYLMPSPTATTVAIHTITRESSMRFLHMFVLDEKAGHWKRLAPLNVTGAVSTMHDWGTDERGEEFLVVPQLGKAVAVRNDKLVLVHVPELTAPSGHTEPETGRLRQGDAISRWGSVESGREYLGNLNSRISKRLHSEVQAGLRDTLEQLDPYDVKDISPDGETVLFYSSSLSPDSVRAVHLKRGSFTEFRLQNRAMVKGAMARFSPKGNYVLVSFFCDEERSTIPGYLQLFTAGGVFLEEITAFDDNDDKSWNPGHFEWLHNNWIVYTTPSHIVFRKFLGEVSQESLND